LSPNYVVYSQAEDSDQNRFVENFTQVQTKQLLCCDGTTHFR